MDLGLASFLTRLTALAQRIILARILGADNIGHIAVVSAVLSVIRLPAGAGTFTVVNKLVAENTGNRAAQQQVVGTSIWVNLGTTLLVGVVAWIILAKTAWVNDLTANRLLRAMVFFLPLLIFGEILKNALMGRRQMKRCARIDITISFVAILVVIPMAYLWSINGWFANQVLMMVLMCVLLFWSLRPIMSLKWDKQVAKTIASMGTFAFLGQLVGVLILQFDTLSVSGILKTPAITGIYNSAALIAQQMMFVPAAILTVVFPFVAQNKNDIIKLREKYWELCKILGISAIIMSIVAWATCPILFALFGGVFTEAVKPFRVLVIGFIAQTLYVLDNTYLDALGRTDITFLSGLFAMVVNIVLNIMFIARWGMIGAAWATSISALCSLAIRHLALVHFVFRLRLIR